jgi:type II secretory pathway pseudopilin PulG
MVLESNEVRFPFRYRSEIIKMNGQRMAKKASQSFTMMELLVVMATIAILALIAYPSYTSIQERAKATADLNNLRQIGLATQMYLNDNDGALFPPSDSWMNDLRPKYLPAWKIFQSPFDTRSSSEDNTNAPVSYGFNPNAKSGSASLLSNKITNPGVFVFFAPAQTSAATVTFSNTAGAPSPGVTVLGTGSNATSNPQGGTATGGTHSNRKRINACMADLHIENMLWSVFINNANSAGDPCGAQRWNPTATCP